MYSFDGNIGYMGSDNLFNAQGETRLVTLKLSREKLLYDIRNYAYIESHKMPDDEPRGSAPDMPSGCAKHLTADIGEDGNVDRATRILGIVHAAAIELLFPMTKKEVVEEEIDNRMWEPDEYVIELHVPEKMSQTTIHLLARLIHEWMVCKVLADWLSITNPKAAENWTLKAMQAEEEIDKIKNNRCGGTTIRPAQPF